MKQVQATYPKTKISSLTLILSLSIAAVLILMTSLQLITFEKFIPIMQNYEIPGGSAAGKLLAAVLVILEIFSLPFLLRMKLSLLFRFVSAGFLLLTGLLWILVSAWAMYHQSPLIGTGLLGGLLKSLPIEFSLMVGVFLLCAAVVLVKLWHADIDLYTRFRKR